MKFRKLKKKEKEKYLKINLYILIYLGITLIISLIGGGMNILAIKTNGNKMPVLLQSFNIVESFGVSYFEDERHFSYDSFNKVNYPILTDIIPLGNSIYSIGDFLMYLAVFLGLMIFSYDFYTVYKIIKLIKK